MVLFNQPCKARAKYAISPSACRGGTVPQSFVTTRRATSHSRGSSRAKESAASLRRYLPALTRFASLTRLEISSSSDASRCFPRACPICETSNTQTTTTLCHREGFDKHFLKKISRVCRGEAGRWGRYFGCALRGGRGGRGGCGWVAQRRFQRSR